MGAIAILTLLGAVALGVICWLGHHVRRETLRRRQVDRVRAALAGQTTVADLRARCGADSLARYPAPRTAVTAPDPAVVRGSTPVRAA